jgi:hypothetical protein
MECAERAKLERDAHDVLDQIINLTKGQQEALQDKNNIELMRLDKLLEEWFGKKERAYGALRQHEKEHGC